MNGEDYGIVFSGGGALAAWEVGCYSAIRSRHNGHPPFVVTGASAGAINAAGVCAGMQAKQLEETWSEITDADVYREKFGWSTLLNLALRGVATLSVSGSVKRFLARHQSIYDNSPLKQTLTKIFQGYYQSFCQSRTGCVLALTNLAQGRKELFYRMPDNQPLPDEAQRGSLAGVLWKQIRSQDILVQALMGSTALPVLFSPFEGYFDGGVLLNQPITPAIALGALNVYVIVPSSEALGETGNLLAITSTLVTTWLSASMIAQIDNVRLRNKIRGYTGDAPIRLCMIRPPQNITERLGVTLLSFGNAVPEMVADGERVAQQRLDRFDPDNEDTWY